MKKYISDPNIVGFESSDDSSTDSEDDDISQNVEEIKNTTSIQNESSPLSSEIIEVADTQGEKIDVEKPANNKESGVASQKKDKKVMDIKPIIRKPAVFVEVNRSEDIQAARLKLPILAEEQQIMEVINDNSVIIIAGETGKYMCSS
ncbi:atp-dependent rna helicase [Holotrichia oblita]|nr:atp-dependent rna helicase [Holotrichia oblita]